MEKITLKDFFSFISVKSFVLPLKVVTQGHVIESLVSDWSPEPVVMQRTKCPVIPSLEIKFSYSLSPGLQYPSTDQVVGPPLTTDPVAGSTDL